jgi:cyclopropane fatty-acyl-phospholipid synthase-like methyltransferase
MIINSKGFWENAHVVGGHYNDHKLIPHLINFLKHENASSIVDLGCGNGFYVKKMRMAGLNASGFDGNPNTPLITDNVCGVMDLSVVKTFDDLYDWVLSFEVGEHLPKEFEDAFITNLHLNNKHGIILSWAVVGQGGTGHFNEQNNDYVKSKICALGYTNDIDSENMLRHNSGLPWFKNTIMVFRKITRE